MNPIFTCKYSGATGSTIEEVSKAREVIHRKMKDQISIATDALEKIEDPRKRGHKEPDDYTEKCCMMNIAHEALKQIKG